MRPDYVVKCSYGNDSIALLQWLHEYDLKHPLGKVVVLYNDTGWAANWWGGRVENGEKLARVFGFIPVQTISIGMRALIQERNIWPRRTMQFCTEILKIAPTMSWLSINDPEGVATLCCGVRREESNARALWPEWVHSESNNEGRTQWSPLVTLTTEERDELIHRAGWLPLPHRSRECRCVNAGSQDIQKFSDEDIVEIEIVEKAMKCWGDNRFMFSPSKKKGRPEGIRAVVEWAKQVKPKKDEPAGGCDSGYCTS